MRTLRAPAAAFLLFASLPACIVPAPTSGDGSAAPAAAPARSGGGGAMVPVRANLGNKVELVGYTTDVPQVTPGTPVKVTMAFRVLEPLSDDVQVFVHVEDADGRMERSNVDHKLGGGQVVVSGLKKGDMVRDEFQVVLNAGMEVRAINLYVGLWNTATDERLKLLNPDTVRNDGKDRVLLAQLPASP